MTKIAAIGGGHGLATTLRAVRNITPDVTAVVSVADDGGSTGRLRRSSDQVAPGDLRKCLVALAEPGSALAAAMEYRFADGELDGHAMGNLLLSAMARTSDLSDALGELGRLLGVRGRVLPSTATPVHLVATTTDGTRVEGQVAVMATAGIDVVALEPEPEPHPEAVERISSADVVLLGPGSLYTSVLAAALPVVNAIAAAPHVIYIANLRPQEGETSHYGTADYVAALHRHGIDPDVVIDDPSLATSADAFVHDFSRLEAEIRAQLARWAQNLIP